MAYDTRFYGMGFSFDEFNGMPYMRLGGSGLKVSRVGLGTWKMGYPERGDGSRVGRDDSFRILDRALELGVTFWDTANRYNESSGNSERVIGEWFRAHPGERRNIVLGTKVRGAMDGRTPNHAGLSRANVLDATYACLERLQVDHIDLMQFHGPDPDTPVQESLEAVADLRSRDLVRYFGLSNVSVAQVQEYREVALEYRLPMGCSVQNSFNPLTGGSLDVLELCAEHQLSFIAHGPLRRGLLTNRYLKGRQVGEGDRLVDEGELEEFVKGDTYERLERLEQLAAGEGLTIAQLTLAYMLRIPGMGPLIPSASTVAQLEENAGAGTAQLSSETMDELKQVFVCGGMAN